MILNRIELSHLLDSYVPITRFNKGEASKIFTEVSQSGLKIVLKNNTPACVLLEPNTFQKILEELEDATLELEALRRLSAPKETYSSDEVLARFGMKDSDLADCKDVELE